MGFNSAPAKITKVRKWMVLKRRAVACNKHVNENLKRWKAAAGTPTTTVIIIIIIIIMKITRVIPIMVNESLTALNLPAPLMSQVQEVLILTPVQPLIMSVYHVPSVIHPFQYSSMQPPLPTPQIYD
jgi:hypothetical protein